MLKRILSIAGKPGLYRLVNQGKNMLIVESLVNGKRTPTYARDKVISLGDISMYTVEGDEPLPNVLQSLYEKAEGKKVDVKAFANEQAIRDFFGQVLPNFDDERVYTTDIKKLLSWYNILVDAGYTEFVAKPEEAKEEAAEPEKAEEAAE